MTTAEARKKMRGTKRVCQSCEVPFYDLARNPIVCPACGATYVLDAQPTQGEASAPAFARRSPWRQGSRRRHLAPATAGEPAASDVAVPAEDDGEAPEAATEAAVGEDVVLEPDQDDADVSELIDREDVEDDSER